MYHISDDKINEVCIGTQIKVNEVLVCMKFRIIPWAGAAFLLNARYGLQF